MGESTTITHAILTIVAVLMASLFAAAVLSQLNNVINSLSATIKNKSDTYRMSIIIIYALYDKNTNSLYIYLKNTGEVPYSDLDNIDVFVKDYTGRVDYYKSSQATKQEYGNVNNILEKGETMLLNITTVTTYTPPLEVKVVFSNGYSVTYTVT